MRICTIPTLVCMITHQLLHITRQLQQGLWFYHHGMKRGQQVSLHFRQKVKDSVM